MADYQGRPVRRVYCADIKCANGSRKCCKFCGRRWKCVEEADGEDRKRIDSCIWNDGTCGWLTHDPGSPHQTIDRNGFKILMTLRRPLGKYILPEEDGRYTAVDNTTGDAWTETFRTAYECGKWLDSAEAEPEDMEVILWEGGQT